jgi:lipopolysaccharide cholinephosphotransferase
MDKVEIETMKSVHAANMKLLLEIDRICKKHRIEYFLDSGTLLGAAREKGFIPWDDDIDLILKRKEYEKFLAVADELSEDFKLVKPSESDFFFDQVIKVVYKKSLLHAPREEDHYYNDQYNHLCVDLFPLDNYGKGLKGRIQIFKLKMLYGMTMSRRYKIDYSKYSFTEKLKVALLASIGKLFSLNKILRSYERVATNFNNSAAELFLSSHYPLSDIDKVFMVEWFNESDVLTINDKPFPVPKGWNRMLTRLYGDYKSLPPIEKRVPDHVNLKEVKVW